MKAFVVDIVLWIAAIPVSILVGLVRAARQIPSWKAAYSASIPCRTCGTPISLLGQWRCTCGYVYRGHMLRPCPICHSLPRIARCLACGCTELLPEHR